MALEDITPIVDSGVPEADNGLPLFSGLEPGSGGGVSYADMTGPESQGPLDAFGAWVKANPQLAGAIFGAGGPLASLIGSLASGGLSGTQSGKTSATGNTNQTGYNNQNQTGYSNQNQAGYNNQNQTTNSQQATNQTGYNNVNTQQTIDPAAQAAEQRLNDTLAANAGGAQGAYSQGLSMLQQLATGAMGMGGGAGNLPGVAAPMAPNTTPTPAAITDFPTRLPTDYDPKIGNLIKQAFGSFVGDLGSQAIVNARNRGFAGGGDLLNSAAAPMMGQSLAQVPAAEAKAYLDHVLQAYGLESENAGRVNAARAGALNAATNALAPGLQRYASDTSRYVSDVNANVNKYGIDRNADVNLLNAKSSLLQALMGPQNNLIAQNTSLLNSAPRGSTQQGLSGSQSLQSLSGTTNTQGQYGSQTQGQTGSQSQGTSGSQSQSQQNGATSGTTGVPIGQAIGQGLNNLALGIGQGVTAGGGPDWAGTQAKKNQSILDLLAKRA